VAASHRLFDSDRRAGLQGEVAEQTGTMENFPQDENDPLRRQLGEALLRLEEIEDELQQLHLLIVAIEVLLEAGQGGPD
jgi:hypothetical protein